MNGLLINYNFCTGCHSCEMACKVEHGFETGEWGIKLTQQGPDQLPDGSWEFNFVPVLIWCWSRRARVRKGSLMNKEQVTEN